MLQHHMKPQVTPQVTTLASVSQVTRLIEGTEYEFRVAASNSAGIGPFSSPSDSAFAVDPLSESPGPLPEPEPREVVARLTCAPSSSSSQHACRP